MTMPTVAATVKQLELNDPGNLGELSNDELALFEESFETDLPGAVPFVMQGAAKAAGMNGEFTWLSRSPGEMQGKQDWNVLVGYLARLFASPYAGLVRELARRHHNVDVAFVNCCIVAAERGGVDQTKLFQLQTSQQLTPDC